MLGLHTKIEVWIQSVTKLKFISSMGEKLWKVESTKNVQFSCHKVSL